MKHRGSYYSELWMGATASSSPVSVTHRVATDTLKTEDSSQLSLSQQYLCIVYSYIHHICIYIYGWWFGTWNFHILAMSSSQLTFIFFRGVGIPPTIYIIYYTYNIYTHALNQYVCSMNITSSSSKPGPIHAPRSRISGKINSLVRIVVNSGWKWLIVVDNG